MTTQVSFFAYGNPRAQGNHAISRNGGIYDHNKNLPSWRAAVIEYAQKAYAGPPLDGALELTVTFWFQCPQSRIRKREPWKNTAPDYDKLLRSIGDALKIAGTIVDDARIVRCVMEKRYNTGRSAMYLGADVTVSVLDNGEPAK